MATARSLKKQKQRLKATQETLNRRWNKVLDTEEKYGGSRHTKSYPKRKLLPEFDERPQRPFRQRTIRPFGRTNDFMVMIEQPLIPHTIYVSSWTKRPVRPGPSTDPEDMLRRRITVTTTIPLIEYQFRINTGRNSSRQHAATCPDTEGLCTLCASPMRCWITNFHRDSNP